MSRNEGFVEKYAFARWKNYFLWVAVISEKAARNGFQ